MLAFAECMQRGHGQPFGTMTAFVLRYGSSQRAKYGTFGMFFDLDREKCGAIVVEFHGGEALRAKHRAQFQESGQSYFDRMAIARPAEQFAS